MTRRFRLFSACGLAVGLAALALVAAARPSRADDDDEEKAEQRQVARLAFVENCLMCHGEDMTSRQRLTPKQWTAEVEKMIGWGTPLPPERKEGLIAYLSETYPSTLAPPPVERISPAQALATDRQDAPEAAPLVIAADGARGSALFAQHCVVCHGAAARGGEIGVNLVAKPILAREDEFRDLLAHGRRRMPVFGAVLDARAQSDLLAYLRQAR